MKKAIKFFRVINSVFWGGNSSNSKTSLFSFLFFFSFTLLFSSFFFANKASGQSITDFTPNKSCFGSNIVVTITGNDFLGIDSVKFNGVAAVFIINNDSVIVATVPPSATTGSIVLIDTNALSDTSQTDFIVDNLPNCFITGNFNLLCPSFSNTYSAPAEMQSYVWSITGNGTIPGDNNDSTVTIVSGNECDSTFTLFLNITDTNGCHSDCQKVVNVGDTLSPTITGTLSDTILVGCTQSDRPAATNTQHVSLFESKRLICQ